VFGTSEKGNTDAFSCESAPDALARKLLYELLNLNAIHLPIGFMIHTAGGPTYWCGFDAKANFEQFTSCRWIKPGKA
jgi:hypothetical protein